MLWRLCPPSYEASGVKPGDLAWGLIWLRAAVDAHWDWLPAICAATHCITSYPVDRLGRYPHSACLRRGSHEDETHLRSRRQSCRTLGWHGHHPSRADRGRSRSAHAFAAVSGFRRLEHRAFRHEPGREIAPQRHHQLACQRDDCDAPDPLARLGGALREPLRERAAGLMAQPQPGELDRRLAGPGIAGLADPLL